MKFPKTESYQNKNLKIAQNRHEPIQTLGNRPYQKHTRKRKTRNFGTVRLLERTNANSDKQSQNHVGRSECSDLRQVVKTDDNQAKQKIQYLKFFKGQKPIKNNP